MMQRTSSSALCAVTVLLSFLISIAFAAPVTRPAVIKFGTLMGADHQAYGTANRLAGMEAAFRDAAVNDELYGTTVELVHLKGEGFNEPIAYTQTKQLVETDGVFGMISTDYESAIYSWAYCEEHKIPNIAPLQSHSPMFERGSNSTFFVMQSFEAEANMMVNYLINAEWNCWNVFIGYYFLVENLAKAVQETLKKLGYPAPRIHPVGSAGDEPYNMTDYLNHLYNDTVEPHCILAIDAASGVYTLMDALSKDPRYEQEEMVVIAPSVAAIPHFAINGSTKPFDNLFIIQSFPDANEPARFTSVASYQASIKRFFNAPNWQSIYSKYPVLATLADHVNFNADAYQGYVNGRFLVEILKRMPSFTRQAMIDTVFDTKLFRIDDMLLGPYSRECDNSFSGTACWCNTGTHTLFVSRVVDGTPKLVLDNEAIGEFGVAHTTIPLTKCSYDSSSFTPPLTMLLQRQVSNIHWENLFYELTNNITMLMIRMVNQGKMVTNGLQIRARVVPFNYTEVTSLEGSKYFLGMLANEYGCMTNIGPIVLKAGTDRVPGFVTSKFTLDLRDPPKEDFDRNTFYFNGVLMDYIHASARYAVDNYKGGVILVGENAEILDMAVSSLYTFQQDYLEKWDIATESDDVAKGESFMAKKIGRVANILYAGQDFDQLADVVGYALQNPQAHVVVATSETVLGMVLHYVGQNKSFTGGKTFAKVVQNLEINLVFPSFANAWWDASTIDQSLVGHIENPIPFAVMNAMTSATVMYEAANKFALTAGQNAALRSKPTALADLFYEAQSLSVGSLSFGPFSDQTCKADQIASKSAACQCNKGPRKFYIHHVNDWMEGFTSENKRTNLFTWTMSSCGVRYEPLKRPTDYTTEIITAAAVIGSCAIILALVIFKVVTAPARDNSAAPKNPDDPFTIIFTDIQSSTSLWARAGEQMSQSVEKHHSLIRKLIKKYDGYEVKTIGDSFMVAFSSTKKAVAFALSIQGTFFDEKWPKEIDETYIALEQEKREAEAEDGKSPVLALPVDLDRYKQSWNGLRVRIGCHYGFGNVKFDPTVLGYDYYGTVVNTAARVEGVGHGGQVLLTAAALSALIDENKGSVPDNYVIKDLGPQPLRGLDEPVALHQFLTPEIKGREFPELRLDIEKTGEDDSETEEEIFSTKGSDSDGSKMTTESVQQALDKYIERICRKWKGDLSFVQTYQEVQQIFQFVKSLWSTSSSPYRTDSVDHLGKKWKVEKSRTLKGALAENVRIVNIIVKVKKTIDITNKPPTESASSKMKNTYNGHTYLGSISQGDVLSPQLLPHGTPYNSANNRMPKHSHSKEELYAHSVEHPHMVEGGHPPSQGMTPPGQPDLIPQHPAIPASTNDQPFRLQDPPPPRNNNSSLRQSTDGHGNGEHHPPGNQSESPRTVTPS